MTKMRLSRGLDVLNGQVDRFRSARALRARERRFRIAARQLERLDRHTLRDIGLLDGVLTAPENSRG